MSLWYHVLMVKIKIKNQEITINLSNKGDDYISLTDIARYKNPDFPADVIKNWMRNKNTIEFLGIWERINNKYFKLVEFDQFKNEAGFNSFVLSPQRWVKVTNSIGIKTSSGRYGGGTFAHKDIAFEFATWVSSEFKLYLIKEFQRLKNNENERLNLGWDIKRLLTKINYKIHTDSIKENIILPQRLSGKDALITYANEADILNVALFGMTSKEWRDKNPKHEGNIRDYANVMQLVCLVNLENLNSEYIKSGLKQKDRLLKLNEVAISQMTSLLNNPSLKKMKENTAKEKDPSDLNHLESSSY